VDAGYHAAAGQQLGALNSTFPSSSTTWIGFAINSFELDFDIEFGLLSSGARTNNFAYTIVTQQLGSVTFEDTINVDFALNVDLYAQIQSSAETKFSTGFNFKVNKQLL
jgi:hypothetical protein